MSWSTRSAISTAAFSVKVRARISSGRARLLEMRCAMRRVRTRVLPVPAPAMIRSGPSPCSTASRLAGVRSSRMRSSAVATSVAMAGVWHAPWPRQVKDAATCASAHDAPVPARPAAVARQRRLRLLQDLGEPGLVERRRGVDRDQGGAGLPRDHGPGGVGGGVAEGAAGVGKDRTPLEVDRGLADALVALPGAALAQHHRRLDAVPVVEAEGKLAAQRAEV